MKSSSAIGQGKWKAGMGLVMGGLSLSLLFQNCAQPVNFDSVAEGVSLEGDAALGSSAPPSTSNSSSGDILPPSTKLVVALGDGVTRGSDPKNPNNTGIKGYAPYLQSQLGAQYYVVNCGIGGNSTSQTYSRLQAIMTGDYSSCSEDVAESASTAAFYNFDNIKGRKPDHVLVLLGTATVLLGGVDQERAYYDIHNIVDHVLAKQSQVTLATIPPFDDPTGLYPNQAVIAGVSGYRAHTFNNMIHQVASDFKARGVRLVDVHSLLKDQWNSHTWDGIHFNDVANRKVAGAFFAALRGDSSATPFVQKEGRACLTGTGFGVTHGTLTCSCSSGHLGRLYRCLNGEMAETSAVTDGLCVNSNKSHGYISYHCPRYLVWGGETVCQNPTTKKLFDKSLCF